jgi:hypothetical protein
MPVLAPDEVARLLSERAERLRMEMRSIDASHSVATEAGVPDLFLVETLYRRSMLAAELEFVRSLAQNIRSAALAGAKEWRRIHELKAEGVTWEQISHDPVGYLGEGAAAFQSDER